MKAIEPRQEEPLAIPRLENCGKYLAQDNTGNWHYLNHANTWQGFQGPQINPKGNPATELLALRASFPQKEEAGVKPSDSDPFDPVELLAWANAFHDGPLMADDHDFDSESAQGKWCYEVAEFFWHLHLSALQPTVPNAGERETTRYALQHAKSALESLFEVMHEQGAASEAEDDIFNEACGVIERALGKP